MDTKQSIFAASIITLAACGAAAAADAPNGPFLAMGGQVVEVGLSFDEAAVRAALPEGLEPAEGFTGGIDIYHLDHGWGIAPYSAGYLWIDLADHPSPDGTPGRFMVQGFYSEKFRAIASLHQEVIVDGSGTLTDADGTISGSAGPNGAEVLKLSVKVDPTKCFTAAEGMGDYIWKDGAGFTVMHIPTVVDGCEALPISVEILASDGPLAALKPTAMLWAVEGTGAAVFAPPVPVM